MAQRAEMAAKPETDPVDQAKLVEQQPPQHVQTGTGVLARIVSTTDSGQSPPNLA